MAIPTLSNPIATLESFGTFIPHLAQICVGVLKDMTGRDFSQDMEAVLQAFFDQQHIPHLDGCDDEILGLVIHNAVHAFLFRLREHNLPVIPEDWKGGACPFCGSRRQIAFDAEDKRELHCLACGHAWRFARVCCPTCANHDYNTLGYFEAEGLQGARVYFCRLCTHYLKAIDTKTRIAHDPETEDALSLELDEIARKEGFSHPTPET